MKKIFLIPLIVLSTLLFSFSVYADTLITEKENDWESINGEWYYIGDKLSPGWIKEDGYWYYTNEENKMMTGKVLINSNSFTFNNGDYENIPYGALIEDNQLLYQEKDTGSISYLEIQKLNEEYDKITIILPGIAEDYNDYKKYGCYLADNHSLVLIPNLYSVDSRYEVGTIPEIITRTSENITKLINLYQPSDEIEINIIGMGVGGMVGSYYVYENDYDVSKLAMILSTPDFASLNHTDFYYTYNNGAKVSKQNEEEIIKKLKFITPLNNVLKLFDTEIYMVNAKEDKYISYEAVSQFYRDMKDEMNITFLSLDSDQHRIKEDSFKRILDFFI